MKKFTLVISAAVFTLSTHVAHSEGPKYYVQFNAGYSSGIAPRLEFSKGDMGKSGLYGAEVGYQINDSLRTSLSFDHRPGFKNKLTDKQEGVEFSSKIKVKSLAVMANMHYDVLKLGRFTPYFVAGVGVARNRTGKHYLAFKEGGETVDAKGTKTNMAYKLGAGTKISISDNLDFDLKYQFANLGRFETGQGHEGYIDGRLVESGTTRKNKGKLRSHEVVLGLTYKF